jgi:hypothetical protein
VVRRVVVVLLVPVHWAPPGIEAGQWRAALAEDVVDRIAGLNEVRPAIGAGPADRPLAESVAWPGMPIYDLPDTSVDAAFAAAAADGYEQAAVIASDAPDVPGLVLGKMLRPLTTRALAIAPAGPGDAGLLGVAVRLPAPAWLPTIDLDTARIAAIRAAAPAPSEVAVTAPWRRVRGPADLATLHPALDGWDATRAILSAPGGR